jgi:hypothetical protein
MQVDTDIELQVLSLLHISSNADVGDHLNILQWARANGRSWSGNSVLLCS